MATATRIGFMGCLFVLLAVPLLVPVQSSIMTKQVPTKLNQTYSWGSIQRRDWNIDGAVLKFPPGYKTQHTYHSANFASGIQVHAIKIIDMWQNGTNANITAVTCPENRSWIKVDFVKQKGKGMAYTIQVWGGRN